MYISQHSLMTRKFSSVQKAARSSVCSGIGSLKGPLHGGANERALADMLDIEDEDGAAAYVRDAVTNKKKIMGEGARITDEF